MTGSHSLYLGLLFSMWIIYLRAAVEFGDVVLLGGLESGSLSNVTCIESLGVTKSSSGDDVLTVLVCNSGHLAVIRNLSLTANNTAVLHEPSNSFKCENTQTKMLAKIIDSNALVYHCDNWNYLKVRGTGSNKAISTEDFEEPSVTLPYRRLIGNGSTSLVDFEKAIPARQVQLNSILTFKTFGKNLLLITSRSDLSEADMYLIDHEAESIKLVFKYQKLVDHHPVDIELQKGPVFYLLTTSSVIKMTYEKGSKVITQGVRSGMHMLAVSPFDLFVTQRLDLERTSPGKLLYISAITEEARAICQSRSSHGGTTDQCGVTNPTLMSSISQTQALVFDSSANFVLVNYKVLSQNSLINSIVGILGLDAIVIIIAVFVLLIAACVFCYRKIYQDYLVRQHAKQLMIVQPVSDKAATEQSAVKDYDDPSKSEPKNNTTIHGINIESHKLNLTSTKAKSKLQPLQPDIETGRSRGSRRISGNRKTSRTTKNEDQVILNQTNNQASEKPSTVKPNMVAANIKTSKSNKQAIESAIGAGDTLDHQNIERTQGVAVDRGRAGDGVVSENSASHAVRTGQAQLSSARAPQSKGTVKSYQNQAKSSDPQWDILVHPQSVSLGRGQLASTTQGKSFNRTVVQDNSDIAQVRGVNMISAAQQQSYEQDAGATQSINTNQNKVTGAVSAYQEPAITEAVSSKPASFFSRLFGDTEEIEGASTTAQQQLYEQDADVKQSMNINQNKVKGVVNIGQEAVRLSAPQQNILINPQSASLEQGQLATTTQGENFLKSPQTVIKENSNRAQVKGKNILNTVQPQVYEQDTGATQRINTNQNIVTGAVSANQEPARSEAVSSKPANFFSRLFGNTEEIEGASTTAQQQLYEQDADVKQSMNINQNKVKGTLNVHQDAARSSAPQQNILVNPQSVSFEQGELASTTHRENVLKTPQTVIQDNSNKVQIKGKNMLNTVQQQVYEQDTGATQSINTHQNIVTGAVSANQEPARSEAVSSKPASFFSRLLGKTEEIEAESPTMEAREEARKEEHKTGQLKEEGVIDSSSKAEPKADNSLVKRKSDKSSKKNKSKSKTGQSAKKAATVTKQEQKPVTKTPPHQPIKDESSEDLLAIDTSGWGIWKRNFFALKAAKKLAKKVEQNRGEAKEATKKKEDLTKNKSPRPPTRRSSKAKVK